VSFLRLSVRTLTRPAVLQSALFSEPHKSDIVIVKVRACGVRVRACVGGWVGGWMCVGMLETMGWVINSNLILVHTHTHTHTPLLTYSAGH
jgi:hypothetical protein